MSRAGCEGHLGVEQTHESRRQGSEKCARPDARVVLSDGCDWKGCALGATLVSLRRLLAPPGPQPRCGCLPPLSHEQGAGAEGGEAGAAGAGIGVWRPRAGPGLRACLPGHPQGLCVHRPCAGPSSATTAAAPASRVSTDGKPPRSHPQTLTWVLDPAFPPPKRPLASLFT